MLLLFKSVAAFSLLSLAAISFASECGHAGKVDILSKKFHQNSTFAIGDFGKAYSEEQLMLVVLDEKIKSSLSQQVNIINCLAYNQMGRGNMTIAFADDGSFQFRKEKLEGKITDSKTVIANR